MLLYSAVPVILLFALYAVFFKLRRNVPLWTVALSAAVGMIPYAVCGCVFSQAYLTVGINLLVAVVLTFCCGITSYAVFVRGYMHRATVDELICSGVVAAVVGYALSGVNIYAFGVFFSLFAFAVLFSSTCFKTQTTLYLALLLGIGAALQSKNLALLAASAAVGAAAVAFSPFTRWSSALAMLATAALLWLFGAYGEAGWQTLVMTAVGVIACLCIPKSVIVKVQGMGKGDNRRAYTGIVNRRGRDLAARLYSTSDVFYDMSKSLENSVRDRKSVV